jgi:general secretion pathway protein G
MRVPAPLTPDYEERRQRKKRREAAERAEDRQSRATGFSLPDFLTTRKPAHLFVFMATLVIVGGLLIGRARIGVASHRKDPRRLAQTDLEALRVAAEQFRLDCGRYPTDTEGYPALLRNPGVTGWRGPYITLLRPDPWLRPYGYAVTNGAPWIRCAGPDGRFGTADDLRAGEPSADDLRDLVREPTNAPASRPPG